MHCNGRHRSEPARIFQEDEALINKKLPKEVLIRVFSFLDIVSLCRCAQVCKYWNILALDGSNWKRIDLFSFQVDVQGCVVENISRRSGGFLKALSLHGCQWVTDPALRIFAEQCNNIEDLNLQGCRRITDLTCESLSQHCPNLYTLDLRSTNVGDRSLKYLSDGCHNLHRINISWCGDITENGVEALARGCPKLSHFIAKGCDQINDAAVVQLARHCPGLEVVSLERCDSITDQSVTAIAENCPLLHYICLSNCPALRDVSLLRLAAHCPRLVTVEVAGCANFTDHGFQALARNCHYLEKMDLEDCVAISDSTLAALAQNCPRLETLTLSHCELITDEGIRMLGTGPCSTEHLAVLELDNCPLITDQSLEHLQACHNLQRIRPLRLPAHHSQRHQTAAESPAQHQRARVLCTADAATVAGRLSPALLSVLHHLMKLVLSPAYQLLLPGPLEAVLRAAGLRVTFGADRHGRFLRVTRRQRRRRAAVADHFHAYYVWLCKVGGRPGLNQYLILPISYQVTYGHRARQACAVCLVPPG
ncbi:F-box/LRR-repeat protein 20 [Amphibalanus amphitrite]|uniref:F-box/LRR-repeat protein 20 n=1 Tax=Amphibalanus amphitrite TaxID=1232801 RepID=A0A6A4W457_AMPAM|nr:F-box/LRR-repeat protein 20 [Amphibalanus amphitrite]